MYLVNVNGCTTPCPDAASAMDAINAAVDKMFEEADKEPGLNNSLQVTLQRGITVAEAAKKGYNS